MKRYKIALFDLDGTLRQTKSGKPFINEPFDQQPIGTNLMKMQALRKEGYLTAGITNQGGVLHGHKSIQACMMEQLHSLAMLKPDLLLFCPDEGYTCFELDPYRSKDGIFRHLSAFPVFRKPQPMMLFHAIEVLTARQVGCTQGHKIEMNKTGQMVSANYKDIDYKYFDDLFYCGDRPEDRQAADVAGIKFVDAKDLQFYGT